MNSKPHHEIEPGGNPVCELVNAEEACRLLLTMDKWERKVYLRWVKAKHPELRVE